MGNAFQVLPKSSSYFVQIPKLDPVLSKCAAKARWCASGNCEYELSTRQTLLIPLELSYNVRQAVGVNRRRGLALNDDFLVRVDLDGEDIDAIKAIRT
jgi:hypothetical protein